MAFEFQVEKLFVLGAERVDFGPEVVDEAFLAVAVGSLAKGREVVSAVA